MTKLRVHCSIVILIIFFFSSRRRHTRYIGDWSSDVCSSDLGSITEVRFFLDTNFLGVVTNPPFNVVAALPEPVPGQYDYYVRAVAYDNQGARSEERRVGKEGRSRRAPRHYEEKRNIAATLRT